MSAPTLWHYTCDHGYRALGDGAATLYTARDLAGPRASLPPTSELVWLTDLDAPHPDALGLTARLLDCDRTRHRYRVIDTATVQRWTAARHTLPRAWRQHLEDGGAMPMHWWVSAEPVPVIYDPIVRAAA